MEMIDHALRYLELGFSVIPVDSQNKRGAPFPWKEFQERRASESEVKDWWGVKYKRHGIAIVTGAISKKIVLDLDRHGEQDGIAVAESLYGWEPGGAYARTGGNGIHDYRNHPGGLVKNMTGTGSIAPGVELKADGGFVYAPPSMHKSGQAYEWIVAPWDEGFAEPPEWLVKEIEAARTGKGDAHHREWEKLFDGVSEGNRNAAASQIAGRYLAMGLSQAEVLMLLSAWNEKNEPPLPPDELENVVESIGRRETFRRNVLTPDGDAVAGTEEEREIALQALSERFCVQIKDIILVGGEPPMLHFVCNGLVKIRAGDITSQAKFRHAMVEATNKIPVLIGSKMTPGWDSYGNLMLSIARRVDPGEEATDSGQLRDWLRLYIERRPPVGKDEEATEPEDPRSEDGIVYVHTGAFRKHVDAEQGVRLSSKAIAQMFASAGFKRKTFNVKLRSGDRTTRSMWGIAKGEIE